MPGRDNGLPARAWTPLRGIDPGLVRPVLAALGDAGIPAYVGGAGGPGADGPGADSADTAADAASTAATARLYVDLNRRDDAERLLTERLPDLEAALGEERTWREIVASFDATPADPVPRWSAHEDLDAGPGPRPDPGAPPGRARPLDVEPPPPSEVLDALEAAGEEHYVPPPPPPLPRVHPVTGYAWASMGGGVVLLIGSALVGHELSPGVALLGVLAIIGGFVTLVSRLGRGGGQPPDDGAVV